MFRKFFRKTDADAIARCYRELCRNSSHLADTFVPYNKKNLTREQIEKVKHLAFYLPQFCTP